MCAIALASGSCTGRTEGKDSAPAAPALKKVDFNADSAFAYVARQVEFGPRVPGSAASKQCAQWLAQTLRQLGADTVVEQRAKVKAYTGTELDICNISASFNSDARRRILLVAHWDSRPWADHDPDHDRRNIPIDGANDGASGVGVILEIARNISCQTPNVGVDVLLVDAEDYGRREDDHDVADEDSWCLGTQYWAANPTIDTSKLQYAVLLDMVGGKDAVFAREYYSEMTSPDILDKVWQMASRSGYGERFSAATGNAVLDDHVYLIRAGIPAIDIIECTNPQTGVFNPTWHTHADNIGNIDHATLKAVGQTLQNLIYN